MAIPIETDVEAADCIVKSISCLHNYIIMSNIREYTVIEIEHTEPIRGLSDTRRYQTRLSDQLKVKHTAAFEV